MLPFLKNKYTLDWTCTCSVSAHNRFLFLFVISQGYSKKYLKLGLDIMVVLNELLFGSRETGFEQFYKVMRITKLTSWACVVENELKLSLCMQSVQGRVQFLKAP